MKGNDFLEKINDIDPILLEEADRKPKKHASPILRFSALAACFSLIIAGVVAIRSQPEPTRAEEPLPQTEEAPAQTDEAPANETAHPATVSLSAQELSELFTTVDEDANGRTNQYKKIYSGGDGLFLLPLPEWTETLPIYSVKDADGADEALEQVTETLLPALKELTGLTETEVALEEETNAFGRHFRWASIDDENGFFTFLGFQTSQNIVSAFCSTSDRLKPLGDFVSMPANASDEEISRLLDPLLKKLAELTGFSGTALHTERQYSYDGLRYLTVTVSDSAEDPLISGLPRSFSHAFELKFCTDWGEGTANHWGGDHNTVYLTRIALEEAFSPQEETFLIQDYAEAISLSEAEEMLNQGYVFGGHSCPLCMAEQPEVDFGSYQEVSLEYVAMENGCYYPFYAFFCDMGQNEYGTPTYARTYVSALKLESLDEYFASQETFHK